MQRATKIVATLGPASSDAGGPAAHARRRRRRRPAQLLARHGGRSPRAREASCATRRASSAAKSRSWPTCRARRSASASSPRARSTLAPGQRFILDAECELGDGKRVGLDYKELPHDVGAGRGAAARRRPDPARRRDASTARASSRASCWAASLSNNKGINRMGGGLTAPALTAKDMDDVKTAAQLEADYHRACRSRRTRKTCTWRASSCAPPAAAACSSPRSSAPKRSPRSTRSSTRPTASWSRAAISRSKSATPRCRACRSA